jgi:hypothetical protein
VWRSWLRGWKRDFAEGEHVAAKLDDVSVRENGVLHRPLVHSERHGARRSHKTPATVLKNDRAVNLLDFGVVKSNLTGVAAADRRAFGKTDAPGRTGMQ